MQLLPLKPLTRLEIFFIIFLSLQKFKGGDMKAKRGGIPLNPEDEEENQEE